MQNLHITNSDKPVNLCSLDVIISVGYHVRSQRDVQFRIWATNILKEYMKKGFVMDDERLKEMGEAAISKNFWTKYIMQSMEKQQQRLFFTEQMQKKNSWG